MTVSRFGDEVADGLFRTVLERPSDGLAKGILADRLDEVGEGWKWLAHAMRWCARNGKWPAVSTNKDGTVLWYLKGGLASYGPEALLPGILFRERFRHFWTPFGAYLALAEGFRQAFAELEA